MSSKKSYLNEKTLDYLKNLKVNDSSELLREINSTINSVIKKHIKHSNKKNEEYENAISLTESEIKELHNVPSWILKEIKDVKKISKDSKTLIIPDGRKYQLNNTLNDLSGSEWTYFTSSVINTNYLTSGENSFAHHIRKVHPSPKPPALMKDIISFFTKENEIVLDYFMGVGGSLLGAAACNRRAIGIDLNPLYIKTYKKAAAELNFKEFPTICGEALSTLQNDNFQQLLNNEKLGLILIDPPYANMMSKKKTGADISIYGNTSTPFTESPYDLGNMSRNDFYLNLKKSVELSSKFLKKNGYIVIFIKDLQPSKKTTNILHADIINIINSIPKIEYKGLKIWVDQSAKLFPYGYPFAFVANQIHQYILIFRKCN